MLGSILGSLHFGKAPPLFRQAAAGLNPSVFGSAGFSEMMSLSGWVL